jgi:hypothetical protein
MSPVTAVELFITVVAAVTTGAVTVRAPAAGFALALLGAVGGISSIGAVKESFGTVRWGTLAALAVGLAVVVVRRRNELRLDPRTLLLLGLLPLVGVVSAAWSFDPRLTVERTCSFAVLLAAMLVLGVLAQADDRHARHLVDALALVSVSLGVTSAIGTALWPLMRANGEARGLFESPNALGLFLGLTIVFPLASLAPRRAGTAASVALVAFYAGVIGISGARSGLLALAVGVATYAVASRAPRALLVTAMLAAAAFTLAVSAVKPSLDPAAPHRPAPGSGSGSGRPPAPPPAPPPVQPWFDKLTGARSEGWRATTGLIGSRPLVGYGFGTGDRVFARYPERAKFVYFEGDNPNDAYLQLVLELGALAVVFFGVLAVAAVRCGRFVLERAHTPVDAALLALLPAALAVGIVESTFEAAGAPWAFLTWLAVAYVLPRRPGGAAGRWRRSAAVQPLDHVPDP